MDETEKVETTEVPTEDVAPTVESVPAETPQKVEEAPQEVEEVQAEVPAEAPETVTEQPKERRRDDNTVYVGKKGTMGYVLAVVTQFNNGAGDVTIKARGKLISRAVDVAEIVRHRFMPNAKILDIVISTEELTSEDGSLSKVSSIEIKIQK